MIAFEMATPASRVPAAPRTSRKKTSFLLRRRFEPHIPRIDKRIETRTNFKTGRPNYVLAISGNELLVF